MPTPRIFVCNNKRERPLSCGLRTNARSLTDHLKNRLQQSESAADYEVIHSRCLGRCPQGPVLGIIPENAWYTYADENDIDEIVTEHLEQGRRVERLSLRRPAPGN